MYYELADSAWPRTGGDNRNSGRTRVRGPENLNILFKAEIPSITLTILPNYLVSSSGIAVSADNFLYVLIGSVLFRVSLKGKIVWSREITELTGTDSMYNSPPTALKNGNAVLTSINKLIEVDQEGGLVKLLDVENSLDDSGISINISNNGKAALTSPTGELKLVDQKNIKLIGSFGYDIVPPAFFDDNSMGVSGYSYAGFCRVTEEGKIVWKSGINADHLPCINTAGFSAVSGAILDRDGSIICNLENYSLFAEWSPERWIARSGQNLAMIDSSGKIIWKYIFPEESGLRWGKYQPVVDGAGKIYVQHKGGIFLFNSQGKLTGSFENKDYPVWSFAIVDKGTIAAIAGGYLLFLGAHE